MTANRTVSKKLVLECWRSLWVENQKNCFPQMQLWIEMCNLWICLLIEPFHLVLFNGSQSGDRRWLPQTSNLFQGTLKVGCRTGVSILCQFSLTRLREGQVHSVLKRCNPIRSDNAKKQVDIILRISNTGVQKSSSQKAAVGPKSRVA